MIALRLADAQLPLPERPYRGIDSFHFVDRPIFCAREGEVQKLIRAVTIYRGVLLYGASGVGKSSLVNAGLLPEALAGGFSPERIRVQPRPGQEIIVERIPLTAAGQPPFLPSLFAADESETRVVLSAKQLYARLREIREGVLPLLIFDQFEEFITLFEEVPQAQSSEETVAAQNDLLEVLTGLLRDHSFPVKLLFSFREDYLAKLNKLFSLYPPLRDQYLRLVPPARSALPEIISNPFKDEALRRHFGRELPEPVVAALIGEIDEQRQGGLVNLSEVQIACLRLWESSDPEALLKRRHVQGLLEDFLADSLQRLGRLRDPAVALLSRMVTGRGTRNVISEEDLLQGTSKETRLPETNLQQALVALEKETGLVRRERRNDTYFYEIVSEFLVPWIRRQKEERAQKAKVRKEILRVIAGAGLVLLVIGGALLWRTVVLSRELLVQEANEKKAEAIKRLNRAKEMMEQNREEIRQHRAEIQAVRVDIYVTRRELEEVRKESGASAEVLAAARKESETLKAQLDGEVGGLLSELKRAEAQRQRAETQLQDLRDQQRGLQAKADNLTADLAACRTELAAQKNAEAERQRLAESSSMRPMAGASERALALSGRVTFQETKAPVPQATLEFLSNGQNARTVSGNNGSYSLSGLAPGAYEVKLTYLGATFRQKAEATSNRTDLNFVISLDAVGDSPLNAQVAENIEKDLMLLFRRYSSEEDLYVSRIPDEKLKKAISSARVPQGERIFAMVDVSTMSFTKRQGILFGKRGLYYFTASFTGGDGPQHGFIPYVDLVSREFGEEGTDVSLGRGQFLNVIGSSFSPGNLIALLEEVRKLVSRKAREVSG